MHTDADSTETEGEVEERRKVAAARRSEATRMSKVGTSLGGISKEGHRKQSALVEGQPLGPGPESRLHSGGDTLDLGKGLFYVGSGFAHLNTSWSYKPPKRRLTLMPPAVTATAGGRSGQLSRRSNEKKKTPDKDGAPFRDGAGESEDDLERERSLPRGGAAEASWTVETSSSDESVRAFVTDDAKYR